MFHIGLDKVNEGIKGIKGISGINVPSITKTTFSGSMIVLEN
jgi:hypothetical protein